MSSTISDDMYDEDEATEEPSLSPLSRAQRGPARVWVSYSEEEDRKLKEKQYQDQIRSLEQEVIKSYLRNRKLASQAGQDQPKHEAAAFEFMQMGTHPLVVNTRALKPKRTSRLKPEASTLNASVPPPSQDENPVVVEVCEHWL